MGADAQTKATFAGDIGLLKVTEQDSSSLDQMVSWLARTVSQNGADQWA